MKIRNTNWPQTHRTEANCVTAKSGKIKLWPSLICELLLPFNSAVRVKVRANMRVHRMHKRAEKAWLQIDTVRWSSNCRNRNYFVDKRICSILKNASEVTGPWFCFLWLFLQVITFCFVVCAPCLLVLLLFYMVLSVSFFIFFLPSVRHFIKTFLKCYIGLLITYFYLMDAVHWALTPQKLLFLICRCKTCFTIY